MKTWAIAVVWLCSVSLWGIMSFPAVVGVVPQEKTLFVGANEFLYTDRFSVWDVPEVAFRYGISDRWAVSLRTWRAGVLVGGTYRLLGDANRWFRLGASLDGGYGYHPNHGWRSTFEAGLVFDISLWRSVRVYCSTGWRWFSGEDTPWWRLSGGLSVRVGSWLVMPEISLVRFAVYEPTLPPMYMNPGLAVGISL